MTNYRQASGQPTVHAEQAVAATLARRKRSDRTSQLRRRLDEFEDQYGMSAAMLARRAERGELVDPEVKVLYDEYVDLVRGSIR